MRKSAIKRNTDSDVMIKPGITALSRCVDSRYTLVTMVAKRARMIGKDDEDVDLSGAKKAVTAAVEEVASGKVGYLRRERCYNEDTFYTENIVDDAVNLDEVTDEENTEAEVAETADENTEVEETEETADEISE